jgi:hypothetical protein
LSDDVSIGVLTKVFPPGLVDRVIARTLTGEHRNRLLPPRLMVYYVMALALFSSGSYQEVMRSLVAGLEWINHRYLPWHLPTKAAIFKARSRLGYEVMDELFSEVARPVAHPGGPGFLHGWRLVAMDGTTLDLPDTPANERFYGRPGTKTEAKSPFPQARVLGVGECGTHAVFGAVVSGFDTAETDLFPALLDRLDASMLLLADRGFFSYPAFAEGVGSGAQLLWRVKANVDLPVFEELPDGSYLSEVRPGSHHHRVGPGPHFPVRVIEYSVSAPGQEPTAFRLVTTLLDPAQVSARELALAYARRWEIEGCFDELKTHERGAGLVLRSKTPSGVLQEIYGYLCVHYALRSLIGDIAQEFDEDPLRISFICTLRAARRSLAGHPAFSP